MAVVDSIGMEAPVKEASAVPNKIDASSTADKVGGLWDNFFDAPKHRGRDNASEESEPRCFRRRLPEPTMDAQRFTDAVEEDALLSRTLARILRYRVEESDLPTDSDGFVPIAALSELPALHTFTQEDIYRVLRTSCKGPRVRRFELREPTSDGGEANLGEVKAKAAYVHDGERQRLNESEVWDMLRRFRGPGLLGGGLRRMMMQNPPRTLSSSVYQQKPQRPKLGFSSREGVASNGIAAGSSRSLMSAPALSQEQADAGKASPAGPDEEGSAAASTAAPSSSAPQSDACEWQLFHEPGTDRVWFWNESTEEVFFADDEKSGWDQYLDANGKAWWWHESTGRFFHEEDAV